MPKPDEAHRLTEKELAALEKRIAKVYREARDELSDAIKIYFERFRERDEEMKALIGTEINGKVWTEQDYKQWRLNQIGRGERYQALREKIAQRMTKANEVAIAYVNDDIAKIYAMNRKWMQEQLAKPIRDNLTNVNFLQWNEKLVSRLIVEEPDLMPYYPAKKALRRGIDLAWGKKQITKTVTRGLLTGASIGKIATDLQARIPEMNRASALRTARTATLTAMEAGRQDAADDLKSKGAIIEKEWVSGHDAWTRPAHMRADGQKKKEDEPFNVGGEKMMFPRDKSMGASGWNIYNCRCGCVRKTVGFKSILTDEQKKRAKIKRVK